MKLNKTICLDFEVIKQLNGEDNASELINSLLLSHYKDNRTEEEIIKDVKNKIIEKKEQEKIDARKKEATDKLTKTLEKEIKKQNKAENGN